MDSEGSRDGQKINSDPVSTEPPLTLGVGVDRALETGWSLNFREGASLFMPASPNHGSTLALGGRGRRGNDLGMTRTFWQKTIWWGQSMAGGVSSRTSQQVWKPWLWGGICGHTIASTKSILYALWIQLLQIISQPHLGEASLEYWLEKTFLEKTFKTKVRTGPRATRDSHHSFLC